MKKLSLPIQIFIALALGIVAGLILLKVGEGGVNFAVSFIKPFGTIFLNLLKFIVVPIVITSIVQGVISLSDVRKVGTIGLTTVAYYFLTTAFAITIGLIFANLFKGTYAVLQTSGLEYEAAVYGHNRKHLPVKLLPAYARIHDAAGYRNRALPRIRHYDCR